MSEGKIAALCKVVGQRRVIPVLDVESRDELDRILMTSVPIAYNLEFEQVLPVCEYTFFAEDKRRRWE